MLNHDISAPRYLRASNFSGHVAVDASFMEIHYFARNAVAEKNRTPRGRFELPRCKTPVAFEATAFPD